jgi:TIR domain
MSGEAPESEGGQPPTDRPARLHVFISYASQDAAVAAALVEALERHGIACWIAPRDVKAGALYADAIVRAIGSAKAFVLVLSESAIASSHVGKEVERASSKKRQIIALRIDAAPLTPALEYFLSESQWIEAQAGNMEPAFAKLIGAIRDHPRNPPAINPPVTSGPSTVKARAASPELRRNRLVPTAVFAIAAVAAAGLLVDKFWVSKHVAQEKPTATASPLASAGVPASSPLKALRNTCDSEPRQSHVSRCSATSVRIYRQWQVAWRKHDPLSGFHISSSSMAGRRHPPCIDRAWRPGIFPRA